MSEPIKIRARDVLACDFVLAPVIYVDPQKSVHDIAKLLVEKKISAVPVIDSGKIVGIVSEGDLLQRHELGTEPREDGRQTSGLTANLAKSRGMLASDVMTRTLVTVTCETTLAEIVETLLAKNIRRVLVTRDEELVGVVSRSDVVRVLAARPEGAGGPMSGDDDIIRFKVIETLMEIPGTTPWLAEVVVTDGVVELNGSIEDEEAREPSRLAVENIPDVVGVSDRRSGLQPY